MERLYRVRRQLIRRDICQERLPSLQIFYPVRSSRRLKALYFRYSRLDTSRSAIFRKHSVHQLVSIHGQYVVRDYPRVVNIVNSTASTRRSGHEQWLSPSLSWKYGNFAMKLPLAAGFCVVCFAVVAAVHALETLGCSRVAMLDFDVHHGNGIAALIRQDPRVSPSTKQLWGQGHWEKFRRAVGGFHLPGFEVCSHPLLKHAFV